MNETTEFDPKRRLCPDGSCIGVITGDGTCSVCGRTASGAAAASPAADPDLADDELPAEGASEAASASGFDPNRRLCDDGACVGVIGADGRCGVCGQQPASP
jgi:hypothetical protein